MIKYDVFVAYLVLCVKGRETGLVSLAKLKIDKDGITLLIESRSISTSFHLIQHQSYPNMLIDVQSKFYWGRCEDTICTAFFLGTTLAFTQASFTVTHGPIPHPFPPIKILVIE